ncbi:MAG: hypothetical protein KC776_35565 [Myxococcales bacterium]|nr:hypothetical protein [Myxococcales bacterium]MCB9578611.1 hypothetical protein [Polyangiaceae bacterium]
MVVVLRRGLVAAGVGLALAATSGVAPAEPAEPAALPACIKVRARAQYGAYGYDHIVSIHDGCDKTAACVVKTDVNPDPLSVRVAPGKTEEVVTFRGSPSYTFHATVRCELVDE